MKNFYFFIIIYFLNFHQSVYASIESSIIVKIDNQIITNFDIKNKILRTLILSSKELNQKNINNLKKKTLNSLIKLKLKEEELSKHNFIVNQFELDQYLNSISSNNIDLLKKKFINNNLDYDLFLEEIKIEIKWKKLIIAKFSQKINIDPSQVDVELSNFIQNNKDLEEYNLSQIEISIEENEISDEKANDIKKEIKKIGFDQAILNYSSSLAAQNKGNIGWVNAKSLSKDIFQVLSKMEIGEISDPIFRQDNVLFLKINQKRTKKLNEDNISKIKQQILNAKRNELFDLYSNSFISQIKNNSLIQYK